MVIHGIVGFNDNAYVMPLVILPQRIVYAYTTTYS